MVATVRRSRREQFDTIRRPEPLLPQYRWSTGGSEEQINNDTLSALAWDNEPRRCESASGSLLKQ